MYYNDNNTTAVALADGRSLPFVHVGATQNKQTALAVTMPQKKLGEEIGYDHARSGLDVLEGKIFGVGTAKDLPYYSPEKQ